MEKLREWEKHTNKDGDSYIENGYLRKSDGVKRKRKEYIWKENEKSWKNEKHI